APTPTALHSFPTRRSSDLILVPVAKLLPPDLPREDLFSALKALGDFGVRSRQHLVVAEAVHVADLNAVDEQPVEPGEVVGALLEDRKSTRLNSSHVSISYA